MQFSENSNSVWARIRLKKKLLVICEDFWAAIKLFVLREYSSAEVCGTKTSP